MEKVVIGNAELWHGDCLEVMPLLPADSVDSIVTDPPYGLSFMGKDWDHGVPGVHFWVEALRVAKPGAILLAFGGTRTFHRLAVAIEDAGWELRDTIGMPHESGDWGDCPWMAAWTYGSGFPKSLDISKAIDKRLGVADQREITHYKAQGPRSMFDGGKPRPASLPASLWQGWGTALKPAWEPVIMARKPFKGTVADNVLQHGTGGINIDGCRVETGEDCARAKSVVNDTAAPFGKGAAMGGNGSDLGRWPSNLIHDGSDEVVNCFPQSNGQSGDVKGTEESCTGGEGTNCFGKYTRIGSRPKRNDAGSAARFFYSGKASKSDRDAGVAGVAGVGALRDNGRESLPRKNFHPTVKPTDLMRYFCRLVTPPGGTVLDMFMGSGSTGKAAEEEGFNFIGIDKTREYVDISIQRNEEARKQLKLNL